MSQNDVSTASRTVEDDKFTAFCARIIRANGRRVAEGNVEGLVDLLRLADELECAAARAARALHDEQGYSWTEIADRIGISRQAARQRWGHR